MPQRRPFSAELRLARGRAEAPPPMITAPGPSGDVAAAVREALRQELPQALGPGLASAVGDAVTAVVEQRLPDMLREAVAAQLPALLHPDAVEAATPPDPANEYVGLIQLELVELLERIQSTRAEISALRPADGDQDQIVSATSELEAVVRSTEQATSEILEAAEHLQGCAEAMAGGAEDDSLTRGFADEIEAQATRILTSCSFQDLTGQRIMAAINTLLYVEESLSRVVELWGITAGTGDGNLMRNRSDDNRPDRHLLNGPQAEGEGVSQDDIDALFG